MRVIKNLLTTVDVLLSPHCDERPNDADVSLLVIHNISLPPKQFGGPFISNFFMGTLDASAHPYFQTIHALRVSSHVLIKRDGDIIQFVPFDKRAWHAGQSIFEGRERCNDYSIGIELEGADDVDFTDKQYQQLAQVSHVILACYPAITQERIVGHSHIAPGRKTDPGVAFDWGRYFRLLSSK
jgi:N-acetyl-anhydromuramoyl-L-alanine amidase